MVAAIRYGIHYERCSGVNSIVEQGATAERQDSRRAACAHPPATSRGAEVVASRSRTNVKHNSHISNRNHVMTNSIPCDGIQRRRRRHFTSGGRGHGRTWGCRAARRKGRGSGRHSSRPVAYGCSITSARYTRSRCGRCSAAAAANDRRVCVRRQHVCAASDMPACRALPARRAVQSCMPKDSK